jgi:2-haloalkanoic acid dehalogenase type II
MRWHAASQSLLRGRAYRPFEDIVRDAATTVGIDRPTADELLQRWDESAPWPDVPDVLSRLNSHTRFIVTNCSDRLGALAAARAGTFDLVMTAERAGAYKPDPRPYQAALDALTLRGQRVLFVAGSAHDIGGASRAGMDVYWANRGRVPAPTDAKAMREEEDLRGLVEVLEG